MKYKAANVKIRPLRKNEIKIAGRIMHKTYSEEMRQHYEPLLKEMFTNQSHSPKFFVAEQDTIIRGIGGYVQSWMNWRIYQIFLVMVEPEHQGNGTGTQLMEKIIAEIKSFKGQYKQAQMILLTTPKPAYYRKKFGFKTIMRFREKEARLMALSLEK